MPRVQKFPKQQSINKIKLKTYNYSGLHGFMQVNKIFKNLASLISYELNFMLLFISVLINLKNFQFLLFEKQFLTKVPFYNRTKILSKCMH